MAERPVSAVSLTSEIEDQLDRIQLCEQYELNNITRHPSTVPSTYQPADDQEHFLNGPTERDDVEPSSRTPEALPRVAGLQQQSKYSSGIQWLRDRNPATAGGRSNIERLVLRSGTFVGSINEYAQMPQQDAKKRRCFGLEGWRFGVFMSIVAVAMCLLVELIMLVCAVALDRGIQDGIGVLFQGDCSKVERFSSLLAIPLNIIGTLLISTSNYVMQCLCAPSRQEVDEAHARGLFLNIGISSVHNLVRNRSWKSLLWLSLVITTVPIHLLLNSAFFGALQSNNYGVMIVKEGWRDPGEYDNALRSFQDYGGVNVPLSSKFVVTMYGNGSTTPVQDLDGNLVFNDNYFEYLSKDDCFARYNVALQSNASNVVLVTKQAPNRYPMLPEDEDLHHGTKLNASVAIGSVVPVLNATYRWEFPFVPQNTSGGIYMSALDFLWFTPTLRSAFTSFDYRYWMMLGEVGYDFNNSKINGAVQWNPVTWMCNSSAVMDGENCAAGGSLKVPATWQVTPVNYEIDHCYSHPVKEQCTLQYSFTILLIVIGCDVLKLVAMISTLKWVSANPLATVGDAIASFMERQDPYTSGRCLLSQKEARKGASAWPYRRERVAVSDRRSLDGRVVPYYEKLGPQAMIWRQKVTRWYSVPSKSRWTAFGILYIALAVASITVLAIGVRDLRRLGITNPWNQGFGAINPNAIFAYPASYSVLASDAGNTTDAGYSIQQTNKGATLFADVITVNTPQLLFSTLYFMYNGMFTSMLTAAEWTQFAVRRKRLRVSRPKRGQRSTYWLQLPWKYSLPLLGTSVVLHWLVSRSLFIVRIDVFGWDGKAQADRNISACGYSPLAILIVILVLALSLLVMGYAGFQKLTPGIPVAGTCSTAIAAACHYDGREDMEVANKPLMWGVTTPAEKGRGGHCSMSDHDVEKPVDGMVYM